ncbi:MAG: DMT family transporter [Patescibacteria group bacterium]
MNPYRLHAYSLLLAVSVIWGVAGVVIKYTLGAFPPLTFLTYRFAIASLAAVLTFLSVGFKIPKDKKGLLTSGLYGFLTSTVALGLLFFGTDETTAIDATLISATAPIGVAAAGAIFLGEHITKREKVGISIAFLGTLVTILEPLVRNGASLAGLGGNLLVFASVIVGAATAVMAKVLLRQGVTPLFATSVSFIVGFLTTAPVAFTLEKPANMIALLGATPLPYHLGVFYMAFISGSLAYTLWHKAQKTIEIGEVGLFAYLYPVFGTPLAVFWLKEKITPPFIVGAAIITLGVAVAEYKKRRYN